MRADAEKAYSSLQARIKFLETHAGQGTTPSGLRIKRIQAKGHNVDELQAKFDDIVREAELKLLEAAKDHLCAEVKVHQEAVRSTTANIEGTIARWKVELRKTDISEDQASSLCVAASAFAEDLSKDSAVSGASKALQTEIDRKEKHKSLVNMDVSEGFVPSETSIREIVRNELRLSSGTTNRVDTGRQRKVSIVHSGPHGKQNTQTGAKRIGKISARRYSNPRKSRPEHRKANQRQRSKSSPNNSRAPSKNARGKGSGHVK